MNNIIKWPKSFNIMNNIIIKIRVYSAISNMIKKTKKF